MTQGPSSSRPCGPAGFGPFPFADFRILYSSHMLKWQHVFCNTHAATCCACCLATKEFKVSCHNRNPHIYYISCCSGMNFKGLFATLAPSLGGEPRKNLYLWSPKMSATMFGVPILRITDAEVLIYPKP